MADTHPATVALQLLQQHSAAPLLTAAQSFAAGFASAAQRFAAQCALVCYLQHAALVSLAERIIAYYVLASSGPGPHDAAQSPWLAFLVEVRLLCSSNTSPCMPCISSHARHGPSGLGEFHASCQCCARCAGCSSARQMETPAHWCA